MKKISLLLIVLILLSTLASCTAVNNVLRKNYKITYDTNEMVKISADYVDMGELPTIPEAPIVEGYVFAGWFFDQEYTNRYFFDYPLDMNTTLYAKFYDTKLGEYIVISNVDQFMSINLNPNVKYLLACDINCNGKYLTPIEEFSGEIDGNGYKIHNFTINETTDVSGLIRTNKGTVQNLSFSDFTFDILNKAAASKAYGLVAAINEGSIINCHILDSNIKLDYTANNSNGNFEAHVGAIAGSNKGEVRGCSNSAVIDVTSTVISYVSGASNQVMHFYNRLGGIVGKNEALASVINCHNKAKIYVVSSASGTQYADWGTRTDTGYAYIYFGGLIGHNLGTVDRCSNIAEITSNAVRSNQFSDVSRYIGSLVGSNDGKITASYTVGNVELTGVSGDFYVGGFAALNYGEMTDNYSSCEIAQTGEITNLYIGGYLALNQGKVYNCYTTANITSDSSKALKVGSFVAFNELVLGKPATINKCFTMSNITLKATPTNSGYFAGENTGTVKECYYSDSASIGVKTIIDEVEKLVVIEKPTCTDGTAKSKDEILSQGFIENTLYLDKTLWLVVDGQLPKLR